MTGRISDKVFLIFIAVSLIVSGCSAKYHFLSSHNKSSLLKIIFLDVAQGESTLLILPDGSNILVDTGSPAAAPMLVDYIRSLGINRIDHLIFTHPHDDHIGGIFNITHSMDVTNFYDNSADNLKSNLFDDYVQVVRTDRSRYHVLHSGRILDFDSVKVEVLNPLNPLTGDINEDSIALRVSYGEISILLTGDIRKVGENRIMRSGVDLKSNILKVGHHGDSNASSEEFLNRVAPEIAILSVGKDNKYSKPHEDALLRIIATGAKLLRTDLHGHITVETDGTTYSIQIDKKLIQSK